MRKLICLVALLTVAVSSLLAQTVSQWSGAVFASGSFKHPQISGVVLTKITDFLDLFKHKNWSLELDAFAGVKTEAEHPAAGVVGLSVGKTFYIARNFDGYLGLAGAFSSNEPVKPGAIIGGRIRF